MKWSEFYNGYSEFSKKKLKSSISSLEGIDSLDELIIAAYDIDDKAINGSLVSKAVKFNVEFTLDNFCNLDGLIHPLFYKFVALKGNLILGTSDEVVEAISHIGDESGAFALYKRAVDSGLRFTDAQLDKMGQNKDEYKGLTMLADKKRPGCLRSLIAMIFLFGNEDSANVKSAPSPRRHTDSDRGSKKKRNGGCDGDCANCPAHYGYRYGRWYYGHGHQHGCEKGGNGGASGKCYRD